MSGVSDPVAQRAHFQRVRTQEERDAVGFFLLAQGWAGLHLGDTLRRLEAESAEHRLLVLRGSAEEVRALAVIHKGRAELFVPLREDLPAAADLLSQQGSSMERLSCLESHLPAAPGGDFDVHVREMTVASTLRLSGREPLAARPAQIADAEELRRIYDPVPWMRLDSAAQWAERIQQQRTWVVEVDGRPVAAGRWTKSFGTAVEVGGVATDPAMRRRGAATAVVAAATAEALAQGLTPVLCFGDPELSSLYHALGFEFVGRELAFRRRPQADIGI
jgi:GNAT superfamily N-acetyltransferase